MKNARVKKKQYDSQKTGNHIIYSLHIYGYIWIYGYTYPGVLVRNDVGIETEITLK